MVRSHQSRLASPSPWPLVTEAADKCLFEVTNDASTILRLRFQTF